MDYIIIYNIYHNNHITLLGTIGSYDDNDTILIKKIITAYGYSPYYKYDFK